MKKAPRRIRIATALTVLVILALVFAGRLPLLPQAGPAILRVAATGAATAAVVVAVLVLLTWLYGRFYCAALCPLGILQDFIGWVSRRKSKRTPRKNLKTLRYTILAVTAGLIAAGWTIPAKLFEPFSVFGRFYAGFVMPVFAKFVRRHGIRVIDGDYAASAAGIAAGAGVLAVLILLVVWKRRIYCTSIWTTKKACASSTATCARQSAPPAPSAPCRLRRNNAAASEWPSCTSHAALPLSTAPIAAPAPSIARRVPCAWCSTRAPPAPFRN